MMLETDDRIMLLGSQKGLFKGPLPPRVFVCHDRSEVEEAVTRSAKRITWVSFTRHATDMLLEEAIDRRADVRGSHLITLTPPRAESIPALLGLFHPVFGLVPGLHWLPKDELVEAIARDDAGDRFIGASIDAKAKTLTLLRGHLQVILAPFSLFPKSRDGTGPDFTRPRLTDYGLTIALGEYEASADAILYESDPVYRRRLTKQRREGERTFGAALRRLRKQRHLTRNDFGPISSKEIARIERNEVEKPHAKTLETIASRLGVRPDEIEGY